jgi:hypothetical protein
MSLKRRNQRNSQRSTSVIRLNRVTVKKLTLYALLLLTDYIHRNIVTLLRRETLLVLLIEVGATS